MSTKTVFNPFTGKFDYVEYIPELYTDPTNPQQESAWVKASIGVAAGGPIGLLLALTYNAGGGTSYTFSYKTIEGTVVTTTLT